MKRACLIGVVAATLLAAPSALARRPSNLPVTRGSQYLALGDSVTFGYVEPQVTPAPDYTRPSTFIAYPEQVASALHLSVANAACPGETSSSLIDAHGPSLACENTPTNSNAHYRFNFPLHVNYKGSQLAYALGYLRHHNRVRLVSLMIGANDFFRCQALTTDACASAAEQAATAAKLRHNIRTILSALRDRAHYRGQIVIVNYYSRNYALSTSVAQSRLLNGVQDAAATPYGVRIADGLGEFGLGSAHAGGSPCVAGLLTQLGAGQCGIHPSFAGQALLAQALERAIRMR